VAFISHQRDGGETSVGISDIADARRASGKVTNPVFFQSFSSPERVYRRTWKCLQMTANGLVIKYTMTKN
jgi:hypothetical protein